MLLGIDIGTSACKTSVFDTDGNVIYSCSSSYPVLYPQKGYVEQDASDWWNAVCICIKKILSSGKVQPSDITAIGVDGQSWSAIPIDKNGNVLSNTPIWMDTRASEICERIKHTVGEDKIFTVSGNAFSPTYTTPKILWFKENRPDIFNNTWKFLQSNSFIVYKLTGKVSQDVSQGYGLHFFDLRELKYNEQLADEMGIPVSMVPDLVNSDTVIGTVTKSASEATGLKPGIPVVAGGLDAACGTLGCGVYQNGETQEQGGQAGGMSICTEKCFSHKKLISGAHVVPGRWLLQGGTVAGGGALNWYSKVFGKGRSFKELDSLAAEIPAGSDGVVFLPYLSGERTPLWDSDAMGVFYGLTFNKSEGHFIRAVLEGVAYSLEHNLRVAEETGAKVSVMNSMGGAANSKLWVQIKADVTGRTINVPYADDATTLGAAILAGVGTGVFKNYEDAVNRTVRISRTQYPNMENNKLYKEYIHTYLDLYPALKPVFEKSH